eukprot:2442-Heterococcus_DN1.PRE.2
MTLTTAAAKTTATLCNDTNTDAYAGAVAWGQLPAARAMLPAPYAFVLFEPTMCGASLLLHNLRTTMAIVDTGAVCLTLPGELFDACLHEAACVKRDSCSKLTAAAVRSLRALLASCTTASTSTASADVTHRTTAFVNTHTIVLKLLWAPVESRPCGNRYVSSSSDNCTVSAASIAAGLPALSFAVQQNGPRLQLPLAALLLPVKSVKPSEMLRTAA